MIRSHTIIRKLMNLELSMKKIITAYEEDEKREIALVNKTNFAYGAAGEFGIRKALYPLKVIQNIPSKTGDYWYDWCFPSLIGVEGETFWEVKSQTWWGNRPELVLQDNKSGVPTNFQAHFEKIDALLIWAIKDDSDTITPLALVDPKGIMENVQPLSQEGKKGISANLRTLHEKGYLMPLNDEWRNRLISF